MARIRALRQVDPLTEWSRWLWRAAAPSMAAAAVMGCVHVGGFTEEDSASFEAPADAEALAFSFHDGSFSAW